MLVAKSATDSCQHCATSGDNYCNPGFLHGTLHVALCILHVARLVLPVRLVARKQLSNFTKESVRALFIDQA
jgi:hypothetical protein